MGMDGWYIELYSPDGTRIWAKDSQTFDQTLKVIQERENGQTVRFIAPRNATVNQLQKLESLEAIRS
jgi:hypothetical protein